MQNNIANYIMNEMQPYFQKNLNEKLARELENEGDEENDDPGFDEEEFLFSEMRAQFDYLNQLFMYYDEDQAIILNVDEEKEEHECQYKIWNFIPEIMRERYGMRVKIVLHMKMLDGWIHKISLQ